MKNLFKISVLLITLAFIGCSEDSPTYTTDTSSSIIGSSDVGAKVSKITIFYETANYLDANSTYQLKVTSSLNATITYKTSVSANPSATYYPLTGAYAAISPSQVLNGTANYIRFDFKYNSTVAGKDVVTVSLKDQNGKVIEKIVNVNVSI